MKRSAKNSPVNNGEKYNMLTIIKEIDKQINPSGKHKRMIYCLCDCGNYKSVRLDSLKNGSIKSCGCLHKKVLSELFTTHGVSHTDEHKTWNRMKKRCYDDSDISFARYGGRNINVCDEWLNSFDKFLEDMGTRPSKQHSIDRIDNNLGYSKENCKWSTAKEQANNKENNRIIEHNGLSMTISQWGDRVNINTHTLYSRIKNGWDIEKSLTTPSHEKISHTDRCNNIIEYNGEKKKIKEWSKHAEVSVPTFYARIKRRWPIEKALKK